LQSWGKILAATARCGLGMTSSNPILTTIKNFPELYNNLLDKNADPLYDQTFNLEKSLEAFDSALKEHNQIGQSSNG
jgi:[NiFe] hydrogenase diaphorase moiety large subunit